ncbi:MAG: DUF2062 domain-containing protein [Parvibaculaceae bacterium]|nr:DUF2062 domain-containing protein [Parvibaculaceae bacterium]
MFKRRVELHPFEKLREVFWPRSGWLRVAQYSWIRVWRLSATPHAIAAGVAAGGFVSCTPFLGFHFLMAGAIAWLFRGNIIASAFGTFVGNPITFPFIWIGTYDLGRWMLGQEASVSTEPVPSEISWELVFSGAFDKVIDVILPMALGGIPIGIAVALPIYFICRTAVDAYQIRRRDALAAKGRQKQKILDDLNTENSA